MSSITDTGEVVVQIPTAGNFAQVVIKPISASGTGTLTAKPVGGDTFHPVHDADGNALSSIDLSAEQLYPISGAYLTAVKVVSSNSADIFTVATST